MLGRRAWPAGRRAPENLSPDFRLGTLGAPLMYYLGRFLQLLGMWLLVVALFTAGQLGPSPRLFGAGIAVFIVGWLAVRRKVGQ